MTDVRGYIDWARWNSRNSKYFYGMDSREFLPPICNKENAVKKENTMKEKYAIPLMENKNMRKLNVTVQCMAVYNSSIMVPRELTFEEAINYAKEHIDEINIGELEYISDSDELDEENCDFDEEEPTGFDCAEDKIATTDNVPVIQLPRVELLAAMKELNERIERAFRTGGTYGD